MAEKRLIDAYALMTTGWHLVRTGESNKFLASMSLADVPTVDAVEVVHGHWIKKPYRDRHDFEYECSTCSGGSDLMTNYCPHCAAKMDGGKDDE